MRKFVAMLMGAISIGAVILIVVLSLAEDETAPGIQIEQSKIAYSPGCDDDVLLMGVTATDDKDGDVSDTLMITKRIKLPGGQMEAVSYVASDGSGNVSTLDVIYLTQDDGKYRILLYEQYSVDMDSLEVSVEGVDIKAHVSEEITTEEPKMTTPDEEQTSEPASEENTTASEEPTAYVAVDGKPAIVLKQNEITITAGTATVNWVSYIDEIYDDKDDRNTLFRRVSLTDNIDFSVPGDYVQGLVCTDEDGNVSEPAKIIVHVVNP